MRFRREFAKLKKYSCGKRFPINKFVEIKISSRKEPHQRGIDGMCRVALI